MYQLKILTHQDYPVATFYAGNTMAEANAFYYAFLKTGLYAGYCIHIVSA